MKTYRIYLIRHGLIEGNLKGQYIGRTDAPLIPEGLAMLEAMKENYVYPEAEEYFTSPMLRCRQTMAALYPGVNPIVVPDLVECNFGEYEGKTAKELADKEEFKRWTGEQGADYAPPGGENTNAFVARVCNGFNNIVKYMMTEGKRDAVICTHGGVIMAILSTYGLPQRKMFEWECLNGKGYCLRIIPSVWMRGGMFEVIGKVPFEREDAESGEDSDGEEES